MFNLTLIDELTILAGAQATTAEATVVKQQLEILRPLEQLWLGQRTYAFLDEINPVAILKVIGALAGSDHAAFDVQVVTEEDWTALPARQSDYLVTYVKLLEAACSEGIAARANESDPQTSILVYNLVRTLMIHHATNGPPSFMDELAVSELWRMIVRANELVVLGCYLAIIHGDAAGLRRIASSARLMAKVLPIGVPKRAGTKWLLVRP